MKKQYLLLFTLFVTALSTGIYFLKVIENNKIATRKLVIK